MELQESPDTDDLQEKLRLRRETRRKKILENAKTRLEKLSMKQAGGDGAGDVNMTRNKTPSFAMVEQDLEYSDPEVEPNIPDHFHLPTTAGTPTTTAIFQQLEDTLRSFESGMNQQGVTQENEKTFLLKYKLHVLLAVTIAYIASVVLNENEGKTFFIIIPLGLVLVSDLTIFQQQKQRNPMLEMIVLFGGRSQHISYAMNVMTNIQIVIADVSIFIFYFCIAIYFGNKFVHLAEVK